MKTHELAKLLLNQENIDIIITDEKKQEAYTLDDVEFLELEFEKGKVIAIELNYNHE